jgi:dihydrolipoamide dehydrogenase
MAETTLIVIGGGPGGIEAARTAAQAGAQVTLIADGAIGGRAGWHSLLPSKVWLGGVEGHGRGIDPQRILSRLHKTRDAWSAQQERMLHELGVSLTHGTATFDGERSVTVTNGDDSQTLTADRFIIATGSVPVFLEQLKPDGRRVIAPRLMSSLDTLPRSIVVIGAGATGCEFAHLFSALGLEVDWVVDAYGILPTYHPVAGERLGEVLAARGVRIYRDLTAVAIERGDSQVVVTLSNGTELTAEMAFAAIGRRPDLDRLGLDRAGLGTGVMPPALNGYGQTVNPAIYLVGDAAGAPMVANKAMTQGRIAARHALGQVTPPYDPHLLVWATYTTPEIAQVGEVSGDSLAEVELAYAEALKPWLRPSREGVVRLAYDVTTRQLQGGLAIGDHAADVLAPVLVALRFGATIDEMADLYAAHPTFGELAFAAARLAG